MTMDVNFGNIQKFKWLIIHKNEAFTFEMLFMICKPVIEVIMPKLLLRKSVIVKV